MAEEGQVISCHTIESLNEQLQKGIESKKLILLDFVASWCAPCKLIAPILNDLAKKMPGVIFVKVDVDELSSVAEDWGVEAMLTIVLMKEGKFLDRIVGAKTDEPLLAIAKHATPAENATMANAWSMHGVYVTPISILSKVHVIYFPFLLGRSEVNVRICMVQCLTATYE